MPEISVNMLASGAMSRLVDASRAAGDRGGATAPEPPQSTLEALLARGGRAHPELALERERFAAHLARCGALGVAPEAIAAPDLYLACAALAGVRGALEKVRRSCRPTLLKYLRSIDAGNAFLADVEQQVWEALLVGRDGIAPKLASYSGRGPLAAFVGITAQRLALSGLRKQSTEARAAAEAAAVSRPVLRDPELAFLKGKYEQDFNAAIRDALTCLETRDRLIYRMHLVDGLAVERIAAAYGVSQSTVSRWLARSRAKILAEVRRLLRERIKLSETALESLLGHMLSQLDVNVSQVLGEMPR
jgi:RNA polymerase sigma-70 factor (ECF subfamily)